ncbi:putative membrane protein [Anaplasma phagocytophilum str. ApWI1]|uniref:Putative membrane protein n=2 Tax=Anaplasma phagocytophilum TaxID=948 RepID=A0A0F3N7M4_ANAPH|nr:putative membrane protein [Anaplasma phagocytophilum str. Webster]KJV62944.1 putative membrane protein [Anaplasma phagocytophilum str. NCH-1]KJV85447.1 putative membrane protein [Anaplasma phagocytophilum str. ApWI1]KJV98406.1 putative membrane protein [Anaplasma phagocytophilum str. Annie]
MHYVVYYIVPWYILIVVVRTAENPIVWGFVIFSDCGIIAKI